MLKYYGILIMDFVKSKKTLEEIICFVQNVEHK